MLSLNLLGCEELSDALTFFEDPGTETENIVLENNIATDIIIVEKVEELNDSSEPDVSELPQKDLAQASEELVDNEGLKFYAYEQLNDEDRILYTEIYSILSTFAKDTKVSSKDPDRIEKAFSYVMLDHPEIFYITGYSFTKYMRGSQIEKITLSGSYTMSKSEAMKKQTELEEYTKKCIEGYSGRVDDYEKVKYVYDYIIKNNEYDMSAPNNQNILSVIESHRTVCQGYAKSMQYILNKMGVFCILCEGIVKATESHVWNIVRIDGEYYHVDATWGDSSYMIAEDAEEFEVPDINYDYLCLTDDAIKETHVIKDNISLPKCNSMRDNYYVREGLYLTELNTDVINGAFERARENGERLVTLKCADANVYTALYNHLIENHAIFDYLDGTTTINFVEFKDECRISFYI